MTVLILSLLAAGITARHPFAINDSSFRKFLILLPVMLRRLPVLIRTTWKTHRKQNLPLCPLLTFPCSIVTVHPCIFYYSCCFLLFVFSLWPHQISHLSGSVRWWFCANKFMEFGSICQNLFLENHYFTLFTEIDAGIAKVQFNIK